MWDLIFNLWNNETIELLLKGLGLICIVILIKYTKFKPNEKAIAIIVTVGFLLLYTYSTDTKIKQTWKNINVEVSTNKK